MNIAKYDAIKSVGQTIWDTLPSIVQQVMIQKEQELIDKEDIIYEKQRAIDRMEDELIEKEEEILGYEKLAEERRKRSVSYTRDQLRRMGVIERIGYNY
jgi:hypothetical protein